MVCRPLIITIIIFVKFSPCFIVYLNNTHFSTGEDMGEKQEAFRERRHLHVCDFCPWGWTLTLHQSQENLYSSDAAYCIVLGTRYDVWGFNILWNDCNLYTEGIQLSCTFRWSMFRPHLRGSATYISMTQRYNLFTPGTLFQGIWFVHALVIHYVSRNPTSSQHQLFQNHPRGGVHTLVHTLDGVRIVRALDEW